jgi:hypothetical protein
MSTSQQNPRIASEMMAEVSIYPVGLLHEWQLFVHAIDRAHARRRLLCSLRGELDRIKARKWSAAKSYFNGYLAESPAGSRAGTGWTRGRAYRDLARHLHSDPRTGR